MDVLIIGGTRNLGHLLALDLLHAGHGVTVFNRGRTADELPDEVNRLRGDRSNAAQLADALWRKSYDAVVDMTLYNGVDAAAVTQILEDRTGHYIFISTGQVYLVRAKLTAPYAEEDYQGPVMDPPQPGTRDRQEWTYGVEKRQAEDALTRAWEDHRFPFTSLRLPMVNSERDHTGRLLAYLLRLKDGGPILIPARPHLPLRHVYAGDVVKAVKTLVESGAGKGRAYNLSQEETASLKEFLTLLADTTGCTLSITTVDPTILESKGLLPDCSPFSSRWMSELDNRLSKLELGIHYTPLSAYIERLVSNYKSQPPPPRAGYHHRQEEISLALQS